MAEFEGGGGGGGGGRGGGRGRGGGTLSRNSSRHLLPPCIRSPPTNPAHLTTSGHHRNLFTLCWRRRGWTASERSVQMVAMETLCVCVCV